MSSDRTHDVVLLGATGFTGRLVAERLAAQGPDDLRWAIAGRDATRLRAVVDSLPVDRPVPAVLLADVNDAASLRRLAATTRVLATTVGPYMEHGEPVVAACAEVGTDYVDLTGEPEFVDRMWLAHHERAARSGSRLVHACGFDSIPYDLGAWYTVGLLPDDLPIRMSGFVRASGSVSGGTYHSAVRAFSRVRQSSGVGAQRRDAERSGAEPPERRVRALPRRVVRGPGGRGWGLPLPTIDPVIVRRSARALPAYGPDFGYGHYAWVRRLPTAVVAPVVLGGMVAVAQIPPGRDLLLKLRPQGDGPDPGQRARSWFTVDLVTEVPGRRIRTRVSGPDPGYDATATMLAQSALCLARDDVPDLAGQLTTARAMGEQLLPRLSEHGIAFEVLSDEVVAGP